MTAHIRIKPHLKAHKLSSEEVLLLGEGERYVLRGAVYAAILPLIEGGHDADAMAERLAGQFPPELVYYALMQLEAKGYAQGEEGAAPPAPDAVWWSAHGLNPAEVAERLACATVGAVNAGAPAEAYNAMCAELEWRFRVGDEVAAGGLAVVACQDYLDPRLREAVEAALANDACVLPVRIGGGQVWLGPLMEAQEGRALFHLLLRRLSNIRHAESSILSQGGAFPLMPEQGIRESLGFAAAAITSAVVAAIAGQPPQGIRQGVTALDAWTLESKAHKLLVASHDALPPAPEIWQEMPPVVLQSPPKRFASDGGIRSATPEETFARLEPLVSDITGLIPDLRKCDAPEGMYVFGASQLFASAAASSGDHRNNRVLGHSVLAGGKGQTEIQAKVSCLGEAIERYCCSASGDEPRRRARIDALGDRAVAPPALLHFSERQYTTRNLHNKKCGMFNWVPMPFEPTREIDWTPGWSLTHARTMWLPSLYCYFRAEVDHAHDFCRGDSNGCAAGNTLEEAILQGFMELAERDACAMWWYNRVRRPGIDLASFQSPFLDRMQELYASAGRSLAAIDITNDLGIPTVIALSWQIADGRRIHVGLGTHLDGAMAVSRAVSELSQSTWHEFLPEGSKGQGNPTYNVDLGRWFAEASIESEPYVLPAPSVALRTAADYPQLTTHDLKANIETCIELLCARGLEMIVLDHTRPEIGFPVARVVVPGLRHFWTRFAPGRLYDVPVELGWVERPLRESELNPKPFFI
jgi:ribosomal protein S12 methylthiotransferase accessory factor